MAKSSVIAKLKGAQKKGGMNIPIQQGRMRFIIDKVKLPTTDSGDTFIAEFRVKSAVAVPGATLDDNATSAQPNPVGSVCNMVRVLDGDVKKREQAAKEIRAFVETLETAGNLSDDDYGTLLEAVINEDPESGAVNPARGREIDVISLAKPKPIQTGPNAGKKFIAQVWQHVELTDEQIEQNRAFLDGKAAEPAKT
jgi:hypothetical protein